MRQSRFFAPTLRQVKADNPGHALLLRGGFVRQLAAGIYTYLPLGWRVLRKIENIVREEMDAAGAVELLMPAMHPQELWAETGRVSLDILFKLNDRKDTGYLLGPTHEEVIVDVVRNTVSSYRQLPQMLYQVQTKFRDEERPRAGLLRGREFVMKDCYSFDAGLAGLDVSFDAMVEAYKKIFTRCGLNYAIVEAAGGGIGGFDTREFMAPSAAGEDVMLFCEADGYAANLELATSLLPPVADREDIGDELEEFDTPGVLTIEALSTFPGGAPAAHQIKTLVYFAGSRPVLVLLRGDHQLHESKLQAALAALGESGTARPGNAEEIMNLLGAHPGSLGAVGVRDMLILADGALRGRSRMTTGANRDGRHVRGVNVERDVEVSSWHDLRVAQAGEMSPAGGGPLQSSRCIELGHVFKLGNKYSAAMGCKYLDDQGQEQIVEMGCYGIGVSRILAAVAETAMDEKGIIWPRELAPFDVHLLLLDRDEELTGIAEGLYQQLRQAGLEVLFDDRNERPGAKFAEADLFGVPQQVVVGKVTRETGEVEIRQRSDKSSVRIAAREAAAAILR